MQEVDVNIVNGKIAIESDGSGSDTFTKFGDIYCW